MFNLAFHERDSLSAIIGGAGLPKRERFARAPVSAYLQRMIGWATSRGLVPYDAAVAAMEARAAAIAAGEADELVWLLEHPPLYTAGVSARDADLLAPNRFPVHHTGRGGQFTYHGPGQRVVYLMLDLRKRGRDVTRFVADLERWMIAALARFDVEAGPREGRVGVWVNRKGPGESREDKIAAIGVRLRKWVSFHGVAFNVAPDLEHFSGITPCGISDPRFGVTSLADLGLRVTMAEADAALRAAFDDVFGPVVTAPPPL
jgi:lipoyl(octanoyl) transferase